MRHRLIPLLGLCALSACAPQTGEITAPTDGAALVPEAGKIEEREDGRCFAAAAPPTETVVVNDVIEVAPEVRNAAGEVTSPAVFRNITRPETQPVGTGATFETVCPAMMSPAFVATLQRAMITRRAYSGPVTGSYDTATGLAVQRFQRNEGIDSPFLAISTARKLGVLAVPRDQL